MTQFTCKGVKQINNGIDKPQKCQNVCYHPTHQQQSDFLILVLYDFIVQRILNNNNDGGKHRLAICLHLLSIYFIELDKGYII
jgi:hypothetical protein